jgi:hypothetical protein
MMPSEALFTPILVRVPTDHERRLWLRFGTVRYAFPLSRFFNSLRARFVPVRFRRRRYGTVHPSIRGCTRTTPVPLHPYRGARAERQPPAENMVTASRVAASATAPEGMGQASER